MDEKGDRLKTERRADLATALRIDLLVVWNPMPDPTLTMDELARRQRIDKRAETKPMWDAATTPEAKASVLADFMAKRGFAIRETAWIIRKPSWER